MRPSGNFLNATLLADAGNRGKVLQVEGRSEPGVKDIHVVVHHADPNRGGAVTAKVANPASDRWPVAFPDTEPRFKTGEKIFVVGLALKAPGGPFAWADALTIE